MGGFLASRFMSDVFNGVANGIIFSLIALSLVVVWQSTNVLNFAQGAMATFATYIGMTQVEHGINIWLCMVISVVVGFIFGGLTERVLIRPLYGKPDINPIVVMVGFLGFLQFLAAAIWGNIPRILPSPFSQVFYTSKGHTIFLSPFVVFQILTAVTVMMIVALVFRFTTLGLKLRAAALAPEVARLLGVRVDLLLTFGWMISSAVGSFTAILVAMQNGSALSPSVMGSVFIFGFIAAAVGGLDSPIGAVVGGLLIGLVEQFTLDYWQANMAPVMALVVLIVVLMIRPRGLFTKNTQRRV